MTRSPLAVLTQSDADEQMQDYFAPEELPGLEKKMRVGLDKLLTALRA